MAVSLHHHSNSAGVASQSSGKPQECLIGAPARPKGVVVVPYASRRRALLTNECPRRISHDGLESSSSLKLSGSASPRESASNNVLSINLSNLRSAISDTGSSSSSQGGEIEAEGSDTKRRAIDCQCRIVVYKVCAALGGARLACPPAAFPHQTTKTSSTRNAPEPQAGSIYTGGLVPILRKRDQASGAPIRLACSEGPVPQLPPPRWTVRTAGRSS